MPYPLIFATSGDMFARVNADASWSVRWDRVLDIAYGKPTLKQLPIWAFAKLLVAAKDNFFLTSWEESERNSGEWKHYEAIIDYLERDPTPHYYLSTVTYNGEIIARVNADATWSVWWEDVIDIARWTDFDYRASALVAMCRLLCAAKDRFIVSPWEEPEIDDE